MRQLVFLCFILLLNCHNAQNKMEIQQIPLEKQITYALQLSMRLPYELYINDIKADYDYIGGNIGVDINPYILKNGKYKIRIKIFPAFKAGKTEISIDDLKNSTILFGKYIRGNDENDIYHFNMDDFIKLNYRLPNKPVASFEQEWEVEITELPYELEGWSKGQDLRKWDQKVLEKKVVEYHKKLLFILNEGDATTWIDLTNKRSLEIAIFDYSDDIEFKESIEDNMNDISEYCKNNMIPLEDFEMKIYAEGKLVTLERKNHTRDFNNESPLDLKGWSPLISKGTISGAADYPIKLYLPEGSDEFVIIRK